MKNIFVRVLLIIFFLNLFTDIHVAQAVSSSDSISEIPKGTVFTLVRELKIPANTRFVLLGKDGLLDFFNGIRQPLNQMEGRYYCTRYSFQNYYYDLTENVFETYRRCINRHRRYYSPGRRPRKRINNSGNGNITIIVNNNNRRGGHAGPSPVYSTVEPNLCSKPEFTFSSLVINPDASDGGGFFRKGYEFTVTKVITTSYVDYSKVTIYFDNSIAEALTIITSLDPQKVRTYQLESKGNGSNGGFWRGLGYGLANISNIAGYNFSITLPEKRYFE